MRDREVIETGMTIASGEQGNNMLLARTGALWIAATALSLALNLALFDLMPSLIDENPGKPEYAQYVEKVNVIRIKRLEPPARKREKKHKIRPKEEAKKLLRKKAIYANRPKKQVIDLPFEINPKLSAVSDALPVLPMKTVALGPLGHLYGIGEIDHPLRPLVQVPPLYPMAARRKGIEGWVNVRFIVDEQGRVDDIRIFESRPQKIFDSSVIRCVSAWRFTPGTVEGVPIKTRVETTIRFDLE